MIPDHTMLIDLWQKVAESGPHNEPHVIVVPGDAGIYTAAFLDTEDHGPYAQAAEVLYREHDLAHPEWIAAMSPCHWLSTSDGSLEPGEAMFAFAHFDPRAHESVAVSIVTLDQPVQMVMYDQPLLEPSTEVMDSQGGNLNEVLTWVLAQMHSD